MGIQNMSETFVYFNSPIGRLAVAATDKAVTRVAFCPAEWVQTLEEKNTPLLVQACRELAEYFQGRLAVFTLPLAPVGTVFQKRVWRALCQVPYGHTCSYKDLAAAAGYPRAARAVGGANHVNPIAIIIPCHRVIAADGSWGGYGAGVSKKIFLLELEKAHLRGEALK